MWDIKLKILDSSFGVEGFSLGKKSTPMISLSQCNSDKNYKKKIVSYILLEFYTNLNKVIFSVIHSGQTSAAFQFMKTYFEP